MTVERPDDSGVYDDETLLEIIAERFSHNHDAITKRDAAWVISLARESPRFAVESKTSKG